MERFERIVVFENEVEARLLEGELKVREIPHALMSYHDSAYDGIFQLSQGWGHLEAPADRRDEILEILTAIREGPASSEGIPQPDEIP